MMTALFPSLKGFQAKGASEKSVSGATSELLSSGIGALQPVMESIDINSRISAKNSTVLPMMGRDMNVMRQNMVKLVKLQGGNPATRADMFFMRAKDREAAYESQFGKKSSPTQIKDSNKKDMGFLAQMLMTAVAPLVAILASLTTAIGAAISGIAGMLGLKSAAALLGGAAASKGLIGAGLTIAGVAAGGAATDYVAGRFGVGKDAEGKPLKIDESQDDANWNKMSRMQKIQSGLARGIEKVGSALFMDNMANQARSDRINKETAYLNQNSPSRISDSLAGTEIPQQAKNTNSKEEFINYYKPLAAAVGAELGVATDVLLAKWGLETGWGKSIIPGTNNLGNIKDPTQKGPRAYDKAEGSNDSYAKYGSLAEFGQSYVDLIKRNFPKAMYTGSDAAAFGAGLKDGRIGSYATDANYTNKIVQTASAIMGSKSTPMPSTPSSGSMVASSTKSATDNGSTSTTPMVIQNSQTTNNNGSGGNMQLASADVMDTELGRLLLTRMY
jgi:flagellum-specific peptidoglycan hydrolase FlgJ